MTRSELLSLVLVLVAVASLGSIRHAVRRDAAWLRDREPGPLDMLPMRRRVKRIHLGTRVFVVVVSLALAAWFALHGRPGH